jgi:hypothetical protein
MMVMMMMVVVVVVMIVGPWDNAVIAVMVVVMVVMMMVEILRDPLSALCLCRSDTGVIHLQRIQCIWNGLQKVAITNRWRLYRFGNARLCGAHCRQRSCSAQKPGNFLIHLFSPYWPQSEPRAA